MPRVRRAIVSRPTGSGSAGPGRGVGTARRRPRAAGRPLYRVVRTASRAWLYDTATNRILAIPRDFARWLDGFLPRLPRDGRGDWLAPGVVTDPSDPKLAHLDGLNLSRAWMLEGIAARLPGSDPRRAALLAAARRHRDSALPHVTGEHYEGGHWLGSFAVYLVTGRGLPR